MNNIELIILDYSTSEAHFYKVEPGAIIDTDYIQRLGHNPDACSWMFSESIGIIKHKGIYR